MQPGLLQKVVAVGGVDHGAVQVAVAGDGEREVGHPKAMRGPICGLRRRPPKRSQAAAGLGRSNRRPVNRSIATTAISGGGALHRSSARMGVRESTRRRTWSTTPLGCLGSAQLSAGKETSKSVGLARLPRRMPARRRWRRNGKRTRASAQLSRAVAASSGVGLLFEAIYTVSQAIGYSYVRP
jgi:hypothetical protein